MLQVADFESCSGCRKVLSRIVLLNPFANIAGVFLHAPSKQFTEFDKKILFSKGRVYMAK